MAVFGAYSRYYNLFYRDKAYGGEAAYIRELLATHRPGAASLLDLGCGTGRHARLLAEAGLTVTGVDRSEEMLAVARRSAAADPAAALEFLPGDLRTVRLGRTFDAVVSLFHVISYQTGNDDLKAAFATVREHLAPGGIFIFDCWYGPAVLSLRPEVRVKRLEDEELLVTRIVEPRLLVNANLVESHYQVIIRHKDDGRVEELQELHRMRYLFRPELELLLAGAGLKLLGAAEWLTGKEPGLETWGVCFVAGAG